MAPTFEQIFGSKPQQEQFAVGGSYDFTAYQEALREYEGKLDSFDRAYEYPPDAQRNLVDQLNQLYAHYGMGAMRFFTYKHSRATVVRFENGGDYEPLWEEAKKPNISISTWQEGMLSAGKDPTDGNAELRHPWVTPALWPQ